MRTQATHGKARIKLGVASRAECRGGSKCKHGARWRGYGLLLWLSSWIANMLLLLDKGHDVLWGVVIDCLVTVSWKALLCLCTALLLCQIYSQSRLYWELLMVFTFSYRSSCTAILQIPSRPSYI